MIISHNQEEADMLDEGPSPNYKRNETYERMKRAWTVKFQVIPFNSDIKNVRLPRGY